MRFAARRRRGRLPARHRLLPEPVVSARATRPRGVVVHDRHSAVDRVRRAAVGLVVRLRRPPGPAGLAMDVPASKACRPCSWASWCSAFSPTNRPTRSGSRPSSGDGSSERIEAEHQAAQARHRVGVREALRHPTVWLLALIMFCCQTGSYGLTLLGSHHRQGTVGLHQSRSRLHLRAAVHRGGGRHGADRPQLRSQRRTIHARRDSDRHRRAGLHRHRPAAIADSRR